MRYDHRGVPVLGFIAPSGTGKTTLLSALIPRLTSAGLRIGCIKHTHHAFEIDHPGKDSHTLRMAGASQVLLGSSTRWALVVESPAAEDPTLVQLLDRLDLGSLDLVLVEGYKLESIPKVEVHRIERAAALLATTTPSVIAVVSNQRPLPALDRPVFDLDQPAALADYILRHVAHCAALRDEAAKA